MKRVLLLTIMPVLIIGCMTQVTRQKEVTCPEVEIYCQPVNWIGLPYDSSFEINQQMDYYYSFEKVKQINTIENEWSLAFLDNKKAALMYDDAGRQRVMLARMSRYNSGTLESGMGIPVAGHAGAMSVCKDKIVFSVSPIEGMIGRADLYEGTVSGNLINNSKQLGSSVHQNDFTWESQPALSADGKVLFFASDRIAGYGSTDLWFCLKLDDGTWSEPFNCGNIINTGCPEITPFINNDNKKLLFSSAGHETVGGYDIFESEISDEFWKVIKNRDFTKLKNPENFFSKPKNLRPPLNTKFDELFPSSPVGIDSLLYYSSNQDADKSSFVSMEGGFDLFVRKKNVNKKGTLKPPIASGNNDIDIKPDIKLEEPELNIVKTFTLTGTVYQAVTLVELEEAEIIVRKMPENIKYKEVKSDKNGKYAIELNKDVKYEVTAQAKDLFFETVTVIVDLMDNIKELKQDFKIPEMLTVRINFPTDVFDNPYKYTLDSNGVETVQTWQIQLDNLAENINKSKDKLKVIVLTGHTDDVGTSSYNLTLGKRRVEFVKSELIKRGVSEELLETKSAGKSKPLAKRENEEIEMYRMRLRRVELSKVLKN
ncbi:MAG: OmpA family protein [bacterium]